MTSVVASPAVAVFVRLKLTFCVPFDAITMGQFCVACLYVTLLFESFAGAVSPWQGQLIDWFRLSAIRALRVSTEIYTKWNNALRTRSLGIMSPDAFTTSIEAAAASEMVDIVVSAWDFDRNCSSYRAVLSKETLAETFDIVGDAAMLERLKPMLLAVFSRSPSRYRLDWITFPPGIAPQAT